MIEKRHTELLANTERDHHKVSQLINQLFSNSQKTNYYCDWQQTHWSYSQHRKGVSLGWNIKIKIY